MNELSEKFLNADNLESFNMVLDTTLKILTILGGLVAAFWTYYHFVRGRIYHARLEPALEGTIFEAGERRFLHISYSLKNTGLNSVEFSPDFSCVRVFECSPRKPSEKPRNLIEEGLGTFRIFEAHKGIEPNEVIRDERIVTLPSQPLTCLKIELLLTGFCKPFLLNKSRRKNEWVTTTYTKSIEGDLTMAIDPKETDRKLADPNEDRTKAISPAREDPKIQHEIAEQDEADNED